MFVHISVGLEDTTLQHQPLVIHPCIFITCKCNFVSLKIYINSFVHVYMYISLFLQPPPGCPVFPYLPFFNGGGGVERISSH